MVTDDHSGGYWSPRVVAARQAASLGLDGNGHRAYPAGACSPVHPSGCLRCLEAENATLKEQLERCKTRLIHAEANYGEELKRSRAFEAQAQELAALLAKQ